MDGWMDQSLRLIDCANFFRHSLTHWLFFAAPFLAAAAAGPRPPAPPRTEGAASPLFSGDFGPVDVNLGLHLSDDTLTLPPSPAKSQRRDSGGGGGGGGAAGSTDDDEFDDDFECVIYQLAFP